jgi:DNA polymerase/3'-5' exonuclease PolX
MPEIRVMGSTAEYVLDLKGVTCTCQHFKFRCKGFPKEDPRRLCKHLKAHESEIVKTEAKPSRSVKARHERSTIKALIDKLEEIIDHFPVSKWEACGSYRRGMPTWGDLDLLLCWKKYDYSSLDKKNLGDWLESIADICFDKGETRIRVAIEGIGVDVRIVSEESWPFALLHCTGSTASNVRLRAIAKRKGLLLNEYGLFQGKTLIACSTEKEIFSALGENFVAPENR